MRAVQEVLISCQFLGGGAKKYWVSPSSQKPYYASDRYFFLYIIRNFILTYIYYYDQLIEFRSDIRFNTTALRSWMGYRSKGGGLDLHSFVCVLISCCVRYIRTPISLGPPSFQLMYFEQDRDDVPLGWSYVGICLCQLYEYFKTKKYM